MWSEKSLSTWNQVDKSLYFCFENKRTGALSISLIADIQGIQKRVGLTDNIFI